MVCAFWAVVVILAMIALLVNRVWSRAPVKDCAQMTVERRRFLFAYLLSLGMLLLYVLLKVYAAYIPEVTAEGLALAELESCPKAPQGQPYICALSPRRLTVGSSYTAVELHGANFAKNAKVNVNRKDHPVQYMSDRLLIVSLEASDVATPKALSIQVLVPKESSAAADAGAAAPSGLPANAQSDSKGLSEYQAWSNSKPLEVMSALPPERVPIHLCWFTFYLTAELRLMIIVLIAGALGSYIHALKSLADYVGNRQLTDSWFWFYCSRPFLGAALALLFYAALRGGFLVGTPADVKFVNPFGAFTLAALAGMFTDKASQKLADLFEVLFKTKADDARADKLGALDCCVADLPKGTLDIAYEAKIKASGGTPPYTWAVVGLPAGLTVESNSGRIHGTPTQAGDFTLKITITDATGKTASDQATLIIGAAQDGEEEVG